MKFEVLVSSNSRDGNVDGEESSGSEPGAVNSGDRCANIRRGCTVAYPEPA